MNKIIQFYREKGLFWIRIFGYGFSIKNIDIHGYLFSERHKHGTVYIIENYIITLLTK